MNQPKHILSVDVEDYFQVEAFRDVVSVDSWEGRPQRVFENTMRVLDLFSRHNASATFFFVGWVAEKFATLVREVHACGHEIACHSYWHRMVYKLSPAQFREDTLRAKEVIEQACGAEVIGYRAPSWSITRESMWALDILSELGFRYDSSIYPIHHDLYGVSGAQRFPYTHTLSNGARLREFPPSTVRLAGMDLPAAGGGYLRIFPLAYTKWSFRQIEHSGHKVVVYCHPWEFDPEQPRIPGARLKSRLRHYTNLAKMEVRVETLLEDFQFQSFRQWTETEAEMGVSSDLPTSRRLQGNPCT